MNRLLFVYLLSSSLFAIQPAPKGVIGNILNEQEWNAISQVLDTRASKLFEQNVNFLTPEKLGLSCPIEKDPKTGRIYIHLKDKPNSFLGTGCWKTVSKSILYTPKPKIVARCEVNKTGFKEVEILKKLQGVAGVVKLYSFIKRSESHCDMFLEYCNSGSLLKVEYEHIPIQESDYFQLFDDILTAVHGIHERGYMHRDLHRGNILLTRKGKGPLRARIIDFGQTISLTKDKDKSVVITKSNSPPETFLTSHSNIDRRKAECYAVGVTLYIIVNSLKPAWTRNIVDVRVSELSKEMRLKVHQEVVRLWQESSKTIVPNTLAGDLGLLAHELMNPNPKLRLSLIDAKTRLAQLRQKY